MQSYLTERLDTLVLDPYTGRSKNLETPLLANREPYLTIKVSWQQFDFHRRASYEDKPVLPVSQGVFVRSVLPSEGGYIIRIKHCTSLGAVLKRVECRVQQCDLSNQNWNRNCYSFYHTGLLQYCLMWLFSHKGKVIILQELNNCLQSLRISVAMPILGLR